MRWRPRWSACSPPGDAAVTDRPRPAVTDSGIPVEPVSRPPSGEPPPEIGEPGAWPFTRGIHPQMYRSKLWTMRQYAGFGTAEETNARFRYLLSQGQTGLSMAFDLPTQLGLDSDDPLAEGEIGRVGVAIDTADDMARVFEGIPLAEVSVSMTINAPAAVLLAMAVAAAERQGVPAAALRGTVQNDILKEYIARGTQIFPPGPSLRLATDLIVWATEHTPKFNPISISGYHIREAGATADQEIGFTLADAIEYARSAVARGLAFDDFAPQLSFFFAAAMDLFEEAAKFRAARRLWARITRDRFGARRPESMMLRFHTQTAGNLLTAQQPDNNAIRVTLQALAAVLGGTQSLHTNAKDEALALPTEDSARLALRTQQILAHECGLAQAVDPLAGSWHVERMTDEIERRALGHIEAIDRIGGMARAIESGHVHREIEAAALRTQRLIDAGERVVVGVNRFQEGAGPEPALFTLD
ncbi:MAG: methylmalonyl-CoA mutase, partial [Candidatus Sumerlaeia bacterium]|nr:methylmalonyl-CoA mutase [Candidatus Sumerlaeia bacterium]